MASPLKELFSDTAYYGLSTIVGRLLNYLLTPILTVVLSVAGNGELATLYAFIAFLNVIFTFGMETAFFRYVREYGLEKTKYTVFSFLCSILFLGACLMAMLYPSLSRLMHLVSTPYALLWVFLIVGLDTLCVLGFAELRYERRLRYFVGVKLGSIVLNVALVLFFLVLCPYVANRYPSSSYLFFYRPDRGLFFVLTANLGASLFAFLALFPLWRRWRFRVHRVLCRRLVRYAIPLVFTGFTGIINEALDRILLPYLTSGTAKEKYIQNGIYATNYKLAMLITIFIQAFRMGAEPFFFKHMQRKDARTLYADTLVFFTIACLGAFLGVVLFLDLWKYFINAQRNAYFAAGLPVVPILLVANIFLGIYYNLSLWYKLIEQTKWGAYLSLFGTLLTLTGNIFFIPHYGYLASAYTTLLCYALMSVASYLLGRHYYPISYPLFRMAFYFCLAFLIYGVHAYLFANPAGIFTFPTSRIFSFNTPLLRNASAIVGLVVFLGICTYCERDRIRSIRLAKA